MNERIKLLAEQSLNEYKATYHNEAKIPEAYLEKFAELIVKECVKICMKNQFDGSDNYNNGSISSAEFIKQHFGVEE